MKYIKNLAPSQTANWQSLSQQQSWKSWSGYAFENICLQHISAIKTALGIAGVSTQHFSFQAKASEQHRGIQIDLLIDRQDGVISLCEIKFYNDELSLSKQDAEELRQKRRLFRTISKTKKQIFIVLITTYGLVSNQYSIGLVDNALTMDDLFQ